MPSPTTSPPPDYLVVGHLSLDRSPTGHRLGGTAAYAALTARALGRRPAIVTACSPDLNAGPLAGLPVERQPSQATTSFENTHADGRRRQRLLARAEDLRAGAIPDAWTSSAIVHLGPIAGELPASMVDLFPDGSLIGITAQGWMRGWDAGGLVGFASWRPASAALRRAQAVVVSLEDLAGDEAEVDKLASACGLLVVTEGANGARVYWNQDARRIPAPTVTAVDSTGAGDVFAAAFFVRFELTRDPWEAARFANRLAAHSVTRTGLESIPTPDEVDQASVVIVP